MTNELMSIEERVNLYRVHMVLKGQWELSHVGDISRMPLVISFREVGQISIGPPNGGHQYKIPNSQFPILASLM